MKIKTCLLSLLLCCFSVFAFFGIAGCGDVSLGTLKENFERLDGVYAAQTEAGVFEEGVLNTGLSSTKYKITFGKRVGEYILISKPGYVELQSQYNVMFAIANDYVDNYREFILKRSESDLSKDARKALNKLNERLVDFTNSIDDFVKSRKDLVEYFDRSESQVDTEIDQNHLDLFKKTYGAMVGKSVELSIALAETVETTEIFELINSTDPTIADTKIIKEYVRAKLLPVFVEFRINEIENKFNWNNEHFNGEGKEKVDHLLTELDSRFVTYKTNFVQDKAVKKLSIETMQGLFKKINNFFEEAESYFQALKGLDLSKMAVSYHNNLKDYVKVNPLAEVYLQKLKQFIELTLPDFMNEVVGIVY